MNVIITRKAYNQISSIQKFILEGYKMPITANRFTERLIDFGFSLANVPLGYKKCTQKKWSVKNYRCATFNKTWIFVYEIKNEKIIIRDLVLGKLIK